MRMAYSKSTGKWDINSYTELQQVALLKAFVLHHEVKITPFWFIGAFFYLRGESI